MIPTRVICSDSSEDGDQEEDEADCFFVRNVTSESRDRDCVDGDEGQRNPTMSSECAKNSSEKNSSEKNNSAGGGENRPPKSSTRSNEISSTSRDGDNKQQKRSVRERNNKARKMPLKLAAKSKPNKNLDEAMYDSICERR